MTLEATKGLKEYRTDNPIQGKKRYRQAINGFNKEHVGYMDSLALLNLAREEIRAHDIIDQGLMSEINRKCKGRKEIDINFLHKQIII